MKIGLIPVNIGVANAEQMIGMAQPAEVGGLRIGVDVRTRDRAGRLQIEVPVQPERQDGRGARNEFHRSADCADGDRRADEDVRLGTGVNILSQTNPLLLAKQSASLDLVSNGRFMLGVGIGWLQEEFVAMGTPFERRGARFDDYVVAMKKVWSGTSWNTTANF